MGKSERRREIIRRRRGGEEEGGGDGEKKNKHNAKLHNSKVMHLMSKSNQYN